MAIEVPDWYRTVALVGQDAAGTPVVVLLDSTGAIMAVMKGEYAGTLKNIAVDASGRVIMIPTDPADVWGNAISMGNAELAVRMGYPGGYDDRGRVLFTDSFEEGLSKGTSDKDGTLSAVEISSTSARLRGLSLKLTAGSDAGRYAAYEWYLPQPMPSKLGAQFIFTVDADTEYILVLLLLYDGSTCYQAMIRYDRVNSKVQYYNSAGVWTDLITSVSLLAYSKAFHYLKMVIDLEGNVYHRVLLDRWSWTTGGISLRATASSTSPRFSSQIIHYGALAANPSSYVDGVVFTQNEPA